jgi:hypothetical protein
MGEIEKLLFYFFRVNTSKLVADPDLLVMSFSYRAAS